MYVCVYLHTYIYIYTHVDIFGNCLVSFSLVVLVCSVFFV